MSIPIILEKSKYFSSKIGNILFSKDFLTILIIILVGMGSYGLGKLSEIHKDYTPVYIENSKELGVSNAIDITENNTAAINHAFPQPPGQVVASKSGKAYHLPWCSGAARIKDTNKIFFSSKEEAEAAGYTPAKNCPGL